MKNMKFVGLLIAIVIVVGAGMALYANLGTSHKAGAAASSGVSSQPTNLNNTTFTSVNSQSGVFIGNAIADVYSWTSLPFSITTATNTVCAILSPAATTTIESLTVNITGATTTAFTFVAGTTTTPYGTSSTPFLTSQTIAASTLGTVSIHGGINTTIVGPSQYVTVGATGVAFTTGFFFGGGTCSMVFRTAGPN